MPSVLYGTTHSYAISRPSTRHLLTRTTGTNWSANFQIRQRCARTQSDHSLLFQVTTVDSGALPLNYNCRSQCARSSKHARHNAPSIIKSPIRPSAGNVEKIRVTVQFARFPARRGRIGKFLRNFLHNHLIFLHSAGRLEKYYRKGHLKISCIFSENPEYFRHL